MASSFALRKTTSATITRLAKSARIVNPRPFCTGSPMITFKDNPVDVENRPQTSVSTRRRESFPTLFSDVFDPLSPTRSLTQMLNMMDQFMDNPFSVGARGGYGVGRGWDVRETEDELHLRMDMPGLDKNQVKVSVEQNTLVVKGECEKESENDEYGRRYSSRIDLSPRQYKVDGLKAEMKNGVLKVMVPKVKDEEKKDVFQVSVD